MDLEQREIDAHSRILAAVEVLADQHHLTVPPALRTVAGTPRERNVKRFEALAICLEVLVLEGIQAGLGKKLAEHDFTHLIVLRQTDDEDLLALDGIGKATLTALRKGLIVDPGPLDLAIDEEVPDLDTILRDLNEALDGEE